MGELLLEISGVSKRFCKRPERALRYATQDIWREVRGLRPQTKLRNGEFWALRNVSLDLEVGEVLGVIGHNGAGKSTLINLIAGLIRPTEGEIRLHTDRVALMDNNGGLNMVQTGRENISTQLALHGCDEEIIRSEIESVIAFADVGEFIDSAVGTYSLGMKLRLAFSIYTRLKPDLFIVDEALSAGDLKFQAKFLTYLREYIDGGGSILLCSHDLYTIQALCRRCALLDHGSVIMFGDTAEVVLAYHKLMDVGPLRPAPEAAESAALNNAVESGMQTPQIGTAVVGVETQGKELARTASDSGERGEMPAIVSLVCRSPMGGVLQPGKPMEVEMVCHSSAAFPEVVWGMQIGRADLFPMAAIGSGYAASRYALSPGENTFHCYIDRLPLLAGEYQVRAFVVDAKTSAVLVRSGKDDLLYRFEVFSLPDLESNIARKQKCFVHIDAEWGGSALGEYEGASSSRC